jgi:hypothetical protein
MGTRWGTVLRYSLFVLFSLLAAYVLFGAGKAKAGRTGLYRPPTVTPSPPRPSGGPNDQSGPDSVYLPLLLKDHPPAPPAGSLTPTFTSTVTATRTSTHTQTATHTSTFTRTATWTATSTSFKPVDGYWAGRTDGDNIPLGFQVQNNGKQWYFFLVNCPGGGYGAGGPGSISSNHMSYSDALIAFEGWFLSSTYAEGTYDTARCGPGTWWAVAAPTATSTQTPTSTDTPTPTETLPPGDWTTLFSDDFEGTFPGAWTIFDNASSGYEWGLSDCQSVSSDHSAWGVGGGASGSTLPCGSNYPDGVNTMMIAGPFDLTDARAAELDFQLWLNTETDYDHVGYFASIDGKDFWGWISWGNSGGWQPGVFDLSDVYTLGDLRGQPQVWIAFEFYSDELVDYTEGGFVDDVVLRQYTASDGVTGGLQPKELPQPVRLLRQPSSFQLP